MADDVITRISDKGEITLPEAVLERQHWDAGTKLVVEEPRTGYCSGSDRSFRRRHRARLSAC